MEPSTVLCALHKVENFITDFSQVLFSGLAEFSHADNTAPCSSAAISLSTSFNLLFGNITRHSTLPINFHCTDLSLIDKNVKPILKSIIFVTIKNKTGNVRIP